MKPSMSAAVVYAATSQDLLAFNPAHETFVYNHWDHEDTWKDIQAGKPGGMSMSIMTLVDPTLAPTGDHTIIITSVAQWDIGRPWYEVKEQYQEDLLAQFEPHFPGLRENLKFVMSGTPQTLERYTRNYQGATYGWELIAVTDRVQAHQAPRPPGQPLPVRPLVGGGTGLLPRRAVGHEHRPHDPGRPRDRGGRPDVQARRHPPDGAVSACGHRAAPRPPGRRDHKPAREEGGR